MGTYAPRSASENMPSLPKETQKNDLLSGIARVFGDPTLGYLPGVAGMVPRTIHPIVRQSIAEMGQSIARRMPIFKKIEELGAEMGMKGQPYEKSLTAERELGRGLHGTELDQVPPKDVMDRVMNLGLRDSLLK